MKDTLLHPLHFVVLVCAMPEVGGAMGYVGLKELDGHNMLCSDSRK
jgi:hypothetical protein